MYPSIPQIFASVYTKTVEFQDFINASLTKIAEKMPLEQITNAAKPAFDALKPYAPYVAAPVAGLCLVKGTHGLITSETKKMALLNLTIGAIASTILYSQETEILSPSLGLFLASAVATGAYLKYTSLKSAGPVASIDAEKTDTPTIEEQTTHSSVPFDHTEISEEAGEKEENTINKGVDKNTSIIKKQIRTTSITVDGVTRRMTEKEEEKFNETMYNVFQNTFQNPFFSFSTNRLLDHTFFRQSPTLVLNLNFSIY